MSRLFSAAQILTHLGTAGVKVHACLSAMGLVGHLPASDWCEMILPFQADSKERYVFFSFPHIAIDADGTVGNISRPGRPGASAACGAIKGALAAIHADGISANESSPGGPMQIVHDSRCLVTSAGSLPEYLIIVPIPMQRCKGIHQNHMLQLLVLLHTCVPFRSSLDLHACLYVILYFH